MKLFLILVGLFWVLGSYSAKGASLYVNSDSTNAISPFTNWSTAAVVIQDAIDAATNGDVVLVTNGVYATGGKAMDGDYTNRVALNKTITVQSINGPLFTTIKGAGATNGPLAVRCAWVTNGATLNGFTLTGGATRDSSVSPGQMNGGGVWCCSITNAVVLNCIIVSNTAASNGGGSRWGALRNCAIIGNKAFGVHSSSAAGGAAGGKMVNCTIVGNYSDKLFGGQLDGTFTNCIIYFNTSKDGTYSVNNAGAGISNCLVAVQSRSISDDPQLVDTFHLAVASPCRAAGASIYYGKDIDGQSWGDPPSIGCDEYSDCIGGISVTIQQLQTNIYAGRPVWLTGLINGRAARLEWAFGDGPAVTNVSFITTHTWTNAGDYPVTFTAYNTDNPTGVATNVLVHVLPLNTPQLESPVLTESGYQLRFNGQPNAFYTLLKTTNLTSPVVWQQLQTITNDSDIVLFTNASTSNATEFYRILVQ